MAYLNLLFLCTAMYMLGKATHDLIYWLLNRLAGYFLSKFSPK